ncbi:MAG: permease [Candidatus Brocadiia bacterium]
MIVEALWDVVLGFWGTLSAMAPYLLFGFFVAGLLSVLIPARLVERHLGGRGLWPVGKAAAFGVPLPLCSCGVIPVSASLRRHGASKGATTAFLLSTPQTGVDSILVTLSLLGPVFAIYRPVAALATGLAGGWLVSALSRPEAGDEATAPPCQDPCCAGPEGRSRLAALFRYGFVTLPRDIGPSLLAGLVVAGLITALVPENYFADSLGAGLPGMLVMMAVGIPIYVCATASVPIAAALIAAGISPGAALVFLVTGPATNAATVATIWKVMGRRTAFVYLGTVAVAALAAGLGLNAIYAHPAVQAPGHLHELLPQAVNVVAAVVLFAVLGLALLYRRRGHGERPAAPAEETLTLDVEGMTCSHCAEAVGRALRECPGVERAEVDLGRREALVAGRGLDVEGLCRAVGQLGYEVSPRAVDQRGREDA